MVNMDVIYILVFLLGLAVAYGSGRLHQYINDTEQTKAKGVPYFWRNFIEDTAVPNIRTRDRLEMLRKLVKMLEREIEDGYEELEIQSSLLEQYRNGTYDKDQPAAQRKGNNR